MPWIKIPKNEIRKGRRKGGGKEGEEQREGEISQSILTDVLVEFEKMFSHHEMKFA